MTTRHINDWEKVVRSLILHMKKAGFKSIYASNGEDSIKSENTRKLAGKVCECDEGILRMAKGGERYRLYIVLGNSPSETVADYSYPDDQDTAAFDKALADWSEMWGMRGDVCPKRELVKN